MSCAAGLKYVCVCEVHASSGNVQGILCCVKHRESFSEDKVCIMMPEASLQG